jgi:predicted PurR-regulated permease PerM
MMSATRAADHSEAATTPSSLTLAGDVAEVAAFLTNNAANAKRTGNICVAATLIIGGLILLLFLFFNQIAGQSQITREQELHDQLSRLSLELKNNPSGPTQEVIALQVKSISNELEKIAMSDLRISALEATLLQVSSTVVRIGAVLVGIFLIQIMVAFARYYYRLANHLLISSAIIRLGGNNISTFKCLSEEFLNHMNHL